MLLEACGSCEFRNAFSSYSELSILEPGRDFSLSPLVPGLVVRSVLVFQPLLNPSGWFCSSDPFFDVPVYA